MKKHTLQLLSGLLAMTLLTGCAAGQTQTEPTSVNQAMLIEQSRQEQDSYAFPPRFTGNWEAQEGKVTIHADAEVSAEQGTALPTATVASRQFTQADVDNLLKVFLKGEPLYERVATKEDCREYLAHVQSPQWQPDPDAPEQTPEQLEKRRQDLIAYYTAELEKAPEERPIIHGFSDSHDPEQMFGTGTVDGVNYTFDIIQPPFGMAEICREGYENWSWGETDAKDYPDEAWAIAQADALIRDLGMTHMVCDDVQPGGDDTLMLYYVPSVNGIRLSSIRNDTAQADGNWSFYSYWGYTGTENIQIYVNKEGVCVFRWWYPTEEASVKEAQTALLPFEEIASIASTMLPIVVVGPKETGLVELDRINGFDTHMDVEIAKVSLTLMRTQDEASSLATIIPVWDFWGTWDWYYLENQREEDRSVTSQPMLTLNAIDGSVVDRRLGY